MIQLLAVLWMAIAPVHAGDPTPPIPGCTLAWSDEFDGAAIDPAKWKPWALGPRRDAINTADAARLDGHGHLVITTTRVENQGKTEIHTGGVWTRDLFQPTFGYFEARIKFHSQVGHWGAFWLNCEAMGKPADPKAPALHDPHTGGVEMDIIEFHHRMKRPDGLYAAQQTLHWDGYGADHKSKGFTPEVQGLTEGFHTFGLLWSAEQYVFFIDGIETWRVREKDGGAISHRPEYLILSLEVGDWAGRIQEATLPDAMEIDWVRVWKPGSPGPAADPRAP